MTKFVVWASLDKRPYIRMIEAVTKEEARLQATEDLPGAEDIAVFDTSWDEEMRELGNAVVNNLEATGSAMELLIAEEQP